jgi:hypothetical protein
MTKRLIRGYAVGLSLLGFSSAWVATARSPWPKTSTANTQTAAAADPRVAALDAREALLRRRAVEVRSTLMARAAAPPVVRYVTVPAVTQTQTS